MSIEFDTAKQLYFCSILRSFPDELNHQREWGKLAERLEDGSSFGNVRRHEIVVAARSNELALQLKLPQKIVDSLVSAALSHDDSKRIEKSLPSKEGGITWHEYHEFVSKPFEEELIKKGCSELIIKLSGAPAFEGIKVVQAILKKGAPFTDEEKAMLILHAVDNWTIGSKWVEPRNGKDKNEFDGRILKNEANPTLKNINEEGRIHFDGKTTFEAQIEVGHEVERVLADMIREATGESVDPLDIPEYVDQLIKGKINKLNKANV